MSKTIQQTVVVGPGGSVELASTGLPEGTLAKVTVTAEQPASASGKVSFMTFFGAAKGNFGSNQEIVDHIRSLRDEWDDDEELTTPSP